jgi:hypothetical protein
MFRRIVSDVAVGVTVCAALSFVDACLDRPVEAGNPITRTNFVEQIQQSSIDKVDLLFDIDNSASMGDKQTYLMEAIPDLIGRLVTPNCIDADGNPTGAVSDLSGNCGTATAEFAPVHNLHIGIVSSSLGERLGNACPTTTEIPKTDPNANLAWQPLAGGGWLDRHNDDGAHLLNRASDPTNLGNYTETPLGIAQDTNPGNGDFLDWFPPASVNMNNTGKSAAGPAYTVGPMPIDDVATLEGDFQQLVVGVHQFGCGIESQLETWYRFLIQPDPYASLTKVPSNVGSVARWSGVDTTILAQRADFLRPDSLVAILVLTDENDSEVDVRSFGGTAWNFMVSNWPPPAATSACSAARGLNYTGLNDPACDSCAFDPSDSNCATSTKGVYKTWPGGSSSVAPNWGYDINLRHVHEKLKYGVDVQFPIQRYLIGLTSTKVPNRDGEYPPDGKGGESSSYQGLHASNLNCTNPLFAKALPTPPNGDLDDWKPQWTPGNPPADPNDDLCNLPVGPRQPNLVFYAHIGGVPHELLQNDPTKTDAVSQAQKDTLTDADWKLILGNDPLHYDYTGIDPHMIEDYKPRTAYAVPPMGHPVSAETLPGGSDPISGREWITDSTMPEHTSLAVDRQYACIFKLTDPTTGAPKPRACDPQTVMTDPTLSESCDCLAPAPGTGAFTHAQVPAVCNDANPTQQDSAKAYPTIRELLLAKLMGAQGIVSSLCPIHTSKVGGESDPLYGYRPAMNAIVTKLKAHLGDTCLPQPLTLGRDPVTGKPAVECLVLGTFPDGQGVSVCNEIAGGGWSDPDPAILAHFRTDQHNNWLASNSPNTADPSKELTCELEQLAPDVKCNVVNSPGTSGSSDGWCYVENPSESCAQAIFFSANAQIDGVTTSLQCLEQEQSVTGDD